MRLNLAIRNIFRHSGRTTVSLLMVAGAVAGIVLFIGFSEYILSNTKRIVIDNAYGHIQVAEKAFWDLAPGSRKSQLIPEADRLARKLASDPEVENVSGRLSLFGLVSTGEITVSAKGMGYDPAKEVKFAGSLNMAEGETLKSDSGRAVILGIGLKKKLNATLGGTVTVLGYTLDGMVNAMDLTVKGIFNTRNSEMDDNVFMMTLATMQALLDTDRVEVLSIRLKDTERTDAVRERIQGLAGQLSGEYQAKTWFELSRFYQQVESFFITQNRVIQIILLALVFLGIMNTIGMSVYERTGEIGTVRALGETERSVIAQFTLEGCILGIVGAVLGTIAGLAITSVIASLHLTMDMPGTTNLIPVEVSRVPSAYIKAMLIVILAATAATWLPAIRASKMAIVDALKKNI